MDFIKGVVWRDLSKNKPWWTSSCRMTKKLKNLSEARNEIIRYSGMKQDRRKTIGRLYSLINFYFFLRPWSKEPFPKVGYFLMYCMCVAMYIDVRIFFTLHFFVVLMKTVKLYLASLALSEKNLFTKSKEATMLTCISHFRLIVVKIVRLQNFM